MRDRTSSLGALLAAVTICFSLSAQGQRRGPFVIRGGGKCLELNGPQQQISGGRAQIWDCTGSPNQLWRIERGRLVNVSNGRCLDVYGPDVGLNGGRVQLADCNGRPARSGGSTAGAC